MRTLFLGVLCAAVSVAPSAQGAAFYPLNEGDTWTYETFDNESYAVARAPAGLRRVVAGADTTIGGDSYRLMAVTYSDYAQTVTGTARCAARVAGEAGAVVWIALRGACGALEADVEVPGTNSAPATYYVGGVPYEGVVQSVVGRVEAVAGVGVVMSTRSLPTARRVENRLLSATVNGASYGEAVTPRAWHAYSPLAVGDRRVVRFSSRYGGSGHASSQVVGQEMVDGILYLRVDGTQYTSATTPTVTGTTTELVRYRDDLGCVVRRGANGSESCPSARLGGMRTLARTDTAYVDGQPLVARMISDGSNLGCTFSTWQHAQGIGLVNSSYSSCSTPGGNFERTDLLYAFVGGVGTGVQPSWAVWPVAGEAAPSPAAALVLRSAGPNPTAGPVRLRAEAATPRTVWLTVTDVLGRVVETRDVALGGGTRDVRIDLSGHAAGLYRVRMGDGTGATAAVSVTLH